MGVLDYRSRGISRGQADGRYIKRYVGAVLAGDTFTQTNSSGTELTLANPNGSVMGGIPLNVLPALIGSNLYRGRFNNRIGVWGPGSVAQIDGCRFNGTYDTPTAVAVSGTQLAALRGLGYDGASLALSSEIIMRSDEGFDATKAGGSMVFRTVTLGTRTIENRFTIGGAAAISELRSSQTSTRIVPVTAGMIQVRNPLNTANVIETGTDDAAFFGGARVTRRAAIANPAGGATIDAEARTAIIAILDALRPTTGYNLIAP